MHKLNITSNQNIIFSTTTSEIQSENCQHAHLPLFIFRKLVIFYLSFNNWMVQSNKEHAIERVQELYELFARKENTALA